ncbi:MAG: hypothetical protein LBL08_03375 [Candidatus Nomurabacteria bacterium]|jgi:hypothetical protein|nr:hypothetical protein [Candidatus Nomurabacteria bacterium]
MSESFEKTSKDGQPPVSYGLGDSYNNDHYNTVLAKMFKKPEDRPKELGENDASDEELRAKLGIGQPSDKNEQPVGKNRRIIADGVSRYNTRPDIPDIDPKKKQKYGGGAIKTLL